MFQLSRSGICGECWPHVPLITTSRARTWRWRRMRRYGELSRDVERSSPRQFFPGCTIAMCGYDFREGQEDFQCLFFESMPTKAVARSRSRNFLTQSTGPSFRPLEYLYVTATRSIRSTPNRTSSFRTPDSVSIAPRVLSSSGSQADNEPRHRRETSIQSSLKN